MAAGAILRGLAVAAALAGLAACSNAPRTAPRPAPAPRDTGAAQLDLTPESAALAAYYASVQAGMQARGLLRRDAGAEIGVTDRLLTENYLRIALKDEYVARAGQLVARETASTLRRWEDPVRIAVDFGATVPAAQRATDRANVAAFAGQLARASGHPVGMADSPEAANFTVLFVNDPERRDLGPRLSALVPGIDRSATDAVARMPPETFCLVFAFSEGTSPVYTRAVAVIRAEHPDLLRLSCIHEELAQGMGLANDSPVARPSIFNDDEEFALLTPQDELMLRIHYDRRLTPGMTAEQARPIVARIAAELMGSGS